MCLCIHWVHNVCLLYINEPAGSPHTALIQQTQLEQSEQCQALHTTHCSWFRFSVLDLYFQPLSGVCHIQSVLSVFSVIYRMLDMPETRNMKLLESPNCAEWCKATETSQEMTEQRDLHQRRLPGRQYNHNKQCVWLQKLLMEIYIFLEMWRICLATSTSVGSEQLSHTSVHYNSLHNDKCCFRRSASVWSGGLLTFLSGW